MKRLMSTAFVLGALALAGPATAIAADMDHGMKRHHGHGDRCERRYARCTKWFPSKAGYCSARLERCEMRLARKYDRHHRRAKRM